MSGERERNKARPYLIWFEALSRGDVALVGGKNASLGEMVARLASKGVRTPTGFATTTSAYWAFIDANGLRPVLQTALDALATGRLSLEEAGKRMREAILAGVWPPQIADAIVGAYRELGNRSSGTNIEVAARSSATAEDLPGASFAGQHETFLNVHGEAEVLDACKRCLASLFTDRAISYRALHGFDHMKVALSVGVQAMVRSDLGGAGVMFSIDTETGFEKVVEIDAAWGLGENVVQGAVDPDSYQVFKPLLDDASLTPIVERRCGSKALKMIYAQDGGQATANVEATASERAAFVLSDKEILTLARWACLIEDHYGQPMDMEWAKDGRSGDLFVVQARPETVQSRREANVFKTYHVRAKGKTLAKGLSIGEAVASGPVCRIASATDIADFIDGAILVTTTTDPDWVPIMKRAAGIVTDHGGRTSHAAIVSRDWGCRRLSARATPPAFCTTAWTSPSPAPKAEKALSMKARRRSMSAKPT